MGESPGDITMLLRSVSEGDRAELDRLVDALYDDMRRVALVHLRDERIDHTIQPTALVHEVYLRLVDQRETDWNDRLHFFAFASTVIRRVLIDHARARAARKRGGGAIRVPLVADSVEAPMPDADLLGLDEALRELAELDERQARVVELRFFGGCTLEEIASLLSVNRRTIDRDWTAARAWLFVRLDGDGAGGDRGDGSGGDDHA